VALAAVLHNPAAEADASEDLQKDLRFNAAVSLMERGREGEDLEQLTNLSDEEQRALELLERLAREIRPPPPRARPPPPVAVSASSSSDSELVGLGRTVSFSREHADGPVRAPSSRASSSGSDRIGSDRTAGGAPGSPRRGGWQRGGRGSVAKAVSSAAGRIKAAFTVVARLQSRRH